MQTGAPSTVIGELIADGKYKTLEFEYIGNFWGGDYRAVALRSDGPYQTWRDLLKASKEGTLNCASNGGYGSTSNLQSVVLKTVLGLEHQFIPFDGDAEAAESVMVIALNIEGINDGIRFMKCIKEVIKKKPIAVLKQGQTDKGKKAVASHTKFNCRKL